MLQCAIASVVELDLGRQQGRAVARELPFDLDFHAERELFGRAVLEARVGVVHRDAAHAERSRARRHAGDDTLDLELVVVVIVVVVVVIIVVIVVIFQKGRDLYPDRIPKAISSG